MSKRPSANGLAPMTPNTRKMAALIREYRAIAPYGGPEDEAKFLARRGVLAVCAATVPGHLPISAPPRAMRAWLRALAKGQR